MFGPAYLRQDTFWQDMEQELDNFLDRHTEGQGRQFFRGEAAEYREHMRTLDLHTTAWHEQAAAEMARRGIRHLVVVDRGELVGVLSMRDIVRCWTQVGATSSMSPP